jgi:hypothetical protein
LYSAFLHLKAITLSSNWQFKFAVETKFCNLGGQYSATLLTLALDEDFVTVFTG